MVVNTTDGPREVDPDLRRGHVVNTSRVVEEDLVFVDEEPEIISVLSAAGWNAVIETEGGLRRTVPLVAWVAQDSGRLYGVAPSNDGRVDFVEGDAEKISGTRFVGYEQANTNDKEK